MSARLYSVVQSFAPYDFDTLVGHKLPEDEAYRLFKSLKTGVTGMFPSSDLSDDVQTGDQLAKNPR